MRRQQQLSRKNRNYVDLVELVRTRPRLHPYGFRAALSAPRHQHQHAPWNNRPISDDTLIKWRRRPPAASSRRTSNANLTMTPTTTTMTTMTTIDREDRCIGTSPACSSVHTQCEAYSQTSISTEVRQMLQDDDSNGEEPIKAEAAEEEDVEDSAHDILSFGVDVDADVGVEEPNSHSDLSSVELDDRNRGGESDSDDVVAVESMPAADAISISDENEDDDDEDDNEDNDNEDNDNEDHDNEDHEVEDNEVDENEADDNDEAEMVEDASDNNIIAEIRSQTMERDETGADEEAGGDGHHNNSVIEIEITLTSGNDDSNSEEEVGGAAGGGEEESE